MLSPGYIEQVPPMVSAFTPGWGYLKPGPINTVPASATYEAADRAVYQPLWVPTVCVAKRMWWGNGTAVAGNVEAGIYRDGGKKPGAKLVTTGSIAQSGTSVVQFGDITDTTLSPGLFWLYLSCSSTSATLFRSGLAGGLTSFDEMFRLQQDSVGPGSAPATATPVESTQANIHMFGFSTTTIT